MHQKLFTVLFGLVFWAPLALAQAPTAAISGTVTDSTGAVLPGAKVEILNEETGISRTAQTNAAGYYLVPLLGVGRYQVTATLEGFQGQVRSGIVLTVGREAVVNLQLAVGAVSATIEVSGEAPLVESTTSSVGGLVGEQAIRDLPLNSRSWDQLSLLEPGIAAYAGGGGGGGAIYGSGTQFSSAGSRSFSNVYVLDGTDIRGSGGAANPGGGVGTNLGVEVIREFKIITSMYSAEYGGGSGAVVSAVTKSGTNQYHGTLFEFLRNSAMDARNFFDVGEGRAPFKRNQFGGVFGGPIKKDRLFFFGGYEGMRQRLATTTFAIVPSVNARDGILPGRVVPVNPRVKPFLALWPNPNGLDFGDGTAEFISASSVPTNQDYFMARVDYQLNSNHSIFGRYTYDADSERRLNSIATAESTTDTGRQYPSFQVTSVLSPMVLNSVRIAYSRSVWFDDNLPVAGPARELSFVPGHPVGVIQIGGRAAGASFAIVGAGTSDTSPRQWVTNLLQYADDLTYITGRHAFKFGGYFKRIQENTAVNTSLRGIYAFNSFEDVLRGTPYNFAAVRPGQSAYRGFRQSVIAIFAQDDLRVNPRLTLNLGLRWEAATDPTESHGRVSNIVNFTDPKATVMDKYFNVTKKNFEPRVGFAWQLNQSGTSVVRAGFGIFHDQVLPLYYSPNLGKTPPFYEVLNISNPRFPDGYLDLETGGLPRVNGVAANLKTQAKNHYTLTIQQQLRGDVVIEVGYVGSKGSNIMRFAEMNNRIYTLVDGQKFWPAGSPRKNPYFDELRTQFSDASSNYNGLLLKLKGSSAGLRYQVAYTFSKVIDELSVLSAGGSGREAQALLDPEDPGRDRGRAVFDITNNLVMNASYSLPFRFNQKTASFVLGGWELSGLATFSDGQPFSVRDGFERSRDGGGGRADRPNLAPGANNNPVRGVTAGCPGVLAGQKLSTPELWYDPCAFTLSAPGTHGNLGRNTLITPGLQKIDLALSKNIALTESAKLQFRAEAFNLLNHANFDAPRPTPFTSSGAIHANAGRITGTITVPRELQFGLKILF